MPNKGRLQEPAIKLLEDAGLGVVDRTERQLFARTRDPELEVIFARAQDIPNIVERGAADLGITGHDLVVESGVEVVELLDLGFGVAKMAVAASADSRIKNLRDIRSGVRVATEFPKIASEFFSRRKIKAEISRISGSAEITPLVGISDVIVDLVSTGTTMKTHGLKIIAELFETSARLIANKKSLSKNRRKIEEVKTAFESVIRARGKKLILMNVPEERLEAVKKVVPGMAGPTISRVEAAKPMLALQAVIDASKVEEVVRRAREAGARDILVVPIERVLP
ncbi:MAG: ATP phosphoribosyltransferase [Candidatus Hadarchaeales archaeon]